MGPSWYLLVSTWRRGNGNHHSNHCPGKVEPQLLTLFQPLDLPSKPSFPPSLPSPLGSHVLPGSSPPLFSEPPYHHTHPRTLTRLSATTHR